MIITARRLLFFSVAIFALSGCLSLRDEGGQSVKLSGTFSEITFRLPLQVLSHLPLLPDRSWKTGEYYEFEAETSAGSVTVRVRYELKRHAYFEDADPSEILADQLVTLRQNFIDPAGRLVETVRLLDESIPIFAFSNVGGEYLAASVPVSGNYEATIYLMSDNASNNVELLNAMKVVLKTFNVLVLRA